MRKTRDLESSGYASDGDARTMLYRDGRGRSRSPSRAYLGGGLCSSVGAMCTCDAFDENNTPISEANVMYIAGAQSPFQDTAYEYQGAGEGERASLFSRLVCATFGVGALLVLVGAGVLVSRARVSTPTTTQGPEPVVMMAPPPEKAQCILWGDPHTHTFDGAAVSWYSEGETWIVKSDEVWIQGRFKSTEYTKGLACVNKVAIGGPFLKGIVIEVPTLDDGDIMVDNKPTNLHISDMLTLTGNLGTILYDSDGKLVDKATGEWTKHVVHMDLPHGVRVAVFRWKNYLDVRVTMPAQPDQDGVCGNFNRDVNDDWTERVMERIGPHVEHGMLLFKQRSKGFVSASAQKLLGMCARTLYEKAQKVCPQELRDEVNAVTEADLQSCALNICFGHDNHALRMASLLGL